MGEHDDYNKSMDLTCDHTAATYSATETIRKKDPAKLHGVRAF